MVNIQETFGLTSIEAMAAGYQLLLVTGTDMVAVRHGVDGFLFLLWDAQVVILANFC